jgi:hypothetical protein
MNRASSKDKWSQPICELLNKKGVSLDATNPRHARKLAWMSTLNEAVTKRDGKRSILINEAGGYNSINPANMYGMGAIASANPTLTGNTQTTSGADKGSGDPLQQLTVTSMHIAAATVAFELLPVIPVEVPLVQMTFVESIYGNARVNDAEESPKYISLPLSFFQAINSDGSAFDGVAVVAGEFVNLTKGQIYFIAGDLAAANTLVADHALKLRFVGQHHITGDYQFQVVDVVTISNGATGAYATSGLTVAAFLTNLATSLDGFALSYDLVANTTMQFADANTVRLGGANASSASAPVVDVVDTKESPIFGASNADGYTETPMPRSTSEQGTEQSITVRTWSTQAKVSDFDITCSVTAKQARDFKALGLSAFEIALEAAKTQLIQSTNNHILDVLFKLGVENHIQIFDATGIQLNLYVDEPSVASSTIANMNISDTNTFKMEKLDGTDVSASFGAVPNFRTSAQDDGQLDILRMVKSRVSLSSAMIGKLSRTQKADFVVCGTGIAAALIDARNHATAPVDQNLMVGSEAISYFGECEGMALYVDPRMDLTDNRILIGRRGNEMDSGLKYFVYDLLSEVETVEGLSMSKKALLMTSYALVAAGHHPEVNYLTIIAETKSGLWA